ncbi:MAG TPA: exopolyphosphatase [Acidimicrobiales bacterium]|nr:exopolyphosphatase [Acidimicrobiales bacterium]
MYRLVTRSDFDGLVCAMLLKEAKLIDDIAFVHPKDVQDGAVEITERDITTNLPYTSRAHLVFDHHASELIRNGEAHANYVIDANAPSAARVVYDYLGGPDRFPAISDDLMTAVDQADSANYQIGDILEPTGWALLNFLMDPRTGLGRFHHFRVSNYELMMQLIDYCLENTVDQVLALPDVAERVSLYWEQQELFKAQLERCTRVEGEVAVVDYREQDVIHAGNRFMVYALFPQCTVSVHVIWGRQRQNTVLAVGKSILNRTNPVDIGALVLGYGGGGHRNAGTCQVPHTEAERCLGEIVAALNPVPASSAN